MMSVCVCVWGGLQIGTESIPEVVTTSRFTDSEYQNLKLYEKVSENKFGTH